MQFIANGPDIPEALLQAHEEGRVVFFCGAGISYPAGLPGFDGLVKDIYRLNGTEPNAIEIAALNRQQYDATLDLLERRLPGQRGTMRRALSDALKPKLRRRGALDTHAALLRLARDRGGALRLVTTNFDRLFHAASSRFGQPFQAYAAPMLPIPKNSKWDGLVYLHGLLPQGRDDIALNRLVVTSGDFGLAYLTERWAARFVGELFRNYVVCFVGYSINDPVLRYMMDALAADRMLGETIPQAWALAHCEAGQELAKTVEWEAKGVTPILYTISPLKHDHLAMHQTLHAWGEIYRDGILGKERIVVAHALAKPSASTRQDDFVGRMLWALSDPSGLPAKRFAELNPVPSLEWLLDAFVADRFGYGDLSRFGVSLGQAFDSNLRFSLVRRPAPYSLAPPMRLATSDFLATQIDDVMFQLGRWLIRHLDDPRVVLWLAECGGGLHDRFTWLVETRLNELSQLERDGKLADLDDIRMHAPRAVPSPLMRRLWRLLLSGRLKSAGGRPDLYRWSDRLEREGLTTTLRLELRDMLSPRVRLSKPFRWPSEVEASEEPSQLRHLVSWELVLAAGHVHSFLTGEVGAGVREVLSELLEDLQQLLQDALDLLKELGEANEHSDRSHWDQPSISPHWQNQKFREWVALIELTRDSWLAVRSKDIERATQVAAGWFKRPYPTFKRLAFFAASQEQCFTAKCWVEWLLVDGAFWLWSVETRREVMRLLVLQGNAMDEDSKARLESAILIGPPRDRYIDDLDSVQWLEISAHATWLRLAKLQESGVELGQEAANQFATLSNLHPDWKLAPHDRDEFSHWMSGTGDPDFEESRQIEVAPRKRPDLIAWLLRPEQDRRGFYEDTWRDVCRTRFFHSFVALCDLARRGIWPVPRWLEALQVWSEDGLIKRSWRYGSLFVPLMPDDILMRLAPSLTYWLKKASESSSENESSLIALSGRFLELPLNEESGIRKGDDTALDEPVMEAINHPIGHIVQALMDVWFRRNPGDDDGLPDDIGPLLTQVCNPAIRRFRHGRVILASRLISLFRADRAWTEEFLLPRFDWASDIKEAGAAWEGFLWGPRLYRPLLLAFKEKFLETASHYGILGTHSRQYSVFLTYAALGPIDGFSTAEWRSAFGALPQEGINRCASALAQAQEGAANQREEYWRNRVRPLWKDVWPKSRSLATPEVSESLAALSIAAGREFPDALSMVWDWLKPIEHPSYITNKLLQSGHCRLFPAESLRLLFAIKAKARWSDAKLVACLNEIAHVAPNLINDPMYRQLR